MGSIFNKCELIADILKQNNQKDPAVKGYEQKDLADKGYECLVKAGPNKYIRVQCEFAKAGFPDICKSELTVQEKLNALMAECRKNYIETDIGSDK
tara:strand:+ start:125 stop:412 length:288 start_codon:yes stop_codon:yes gene_type:complete